MNIYPQNPARNFKVGKPENEIVMKDCGKIVLEHDEQVTFSNSSGLEYDIARKDWGFYATPSLNGRLSSFGLRGVLVKNRESDSFFILLVEKGKEALFDEYCNLENLAVVTWLDCEQSLKNLEEKLEE
jgi:hypothetical protein